MSYWVFFFTELLLSISSLSYIATLTWKLKLFRWHRWNDRETFELSLMEVFLQQTLILHFYKTSKKEWYSDTQTAVVKLQNPLCYSSDMHSIVLLDNKGPLKILTTDTSQSLLNANLCFSLIPIYNMHGHTPRQSIGFCDINILVTLSSSTISELKINVNAIYFSVFNHYSINVVSSLAIS